MNVLVIDNDVMIALIEFLYKANKDSFSRVINYLKLNYGEIWIPGTVYCEFCLKREDPKKKTLLDKIMSKYNLLVKCPYKVNKSEIRIIVGQAEDNHGEADAILQIKKATSCDRIKGRIILERIAFISNDSGAITQAKKYGIDTYPYSELRNKMNEAGVILP